MMKEKTKSKTNRKSVCLIKSKFLVVSMLTVCGLLSSSCQASPQAESAGNNLTENKTISAANPGQAAMDVSEQDRRTVEAAVANFHQLYDQQKFEEIYALIDEKARTLIKQKAFIKLLKKSYQEAGKVKKTEQVEISESGQPDLRSIEAIYETEYQQTTRQEKFRWVITAGVAKLFFYSQPPKRAPMMLGKDKKQ
ncbi:MAG: hypothetical protein ACR2MD_12020 [Aridibacter sp.]